MDFKQYQPSQRGNAPRISNTTWEKYRTLLIDWHNQNLTRETMLENLRHLGFYPSPGQLHNKMKAWGLHRYGVDPTTISMPAPVPDVAAEPLRLITHSSEANFELCLNETLDNWIKSMRRYDSDLTHQSLCHKFPPSQRLNLHACAALAYISGRSTLAYDFVMLKLSLESRKDTVITAGLARSLVQLGLIAFYSPEIAEDLLRLFQAAEEHFKSRSMRGATQCMRLSCNMLLEYGRSGRMDGEKGKMPFLALHLADGSSMVGELTETTRQDVFNRIRSCVLAQGYVRSIIVRCLFIVDKLFRNPKTVWSDKLDLLNDVGEILWHSWAWTTIPTLNNDCTTTPHSTCPLQFVFTTITCCQIFIRTAIESTFETNSLDMVCASDGYVKSMICRALKRLSTLDATAQAKLLLDTWQRGPDIGFGRTLHRPVSGVRGFTTWSPDNESCFSTEELIMKSRWCHSVVFDDLFKGLFDHPNSMHFSADALDIELRDEITEEIASDPQISGSTVDPSSPTYDVFKRTGIESLPHESMAPPKTKAAKSTLIDTHSSWSFHRVSGFPKMTSSVASKDSLATRDYEHHLQSIRTAGDETLRPYTMDSMVFGCRGGGTELHMPDRIEEFE